jgi:hypothetical protein
MRVSVNGRNRRSDQPPAKVVRGGDGGMVLRGASWAAYREEVADPYRQAGTQRYQRLENNRTFIHSDAEKIVAHHEMVCANQPRAAHA